MVVASWCLAIATMKCRLIPDVFKQEMAIELIGVIGIVKGSSQSGALEKALSLGIRQSYLRWGYVGKETRVERDTSDF